MTKQANLNPELMQTVAHELVQPDNGHLRAESGATTDVEKAYVQGSYRYPT